jgi:uncharacterized protein (TIGR02284 family)
MMTNTEMIERLTSLIQLDIDAVHAYEQALKQIDDSTMHAQITAFRDDHQRHIADLSAKVSAIGGEPPEYSPDFKGYLIEGFTALRSITGSEGALNAMESNEKLTNKKYEEALEWDLTPEFGALIRKNFEDERRHLIYIQNALREK